MKLKSNKLTLGIVSGITVLVALFTFSLYTFKNSYAIPIDNTGAATDSFTSNYAKNGDKKNYVFDSLGSSNPTYTPFADNFAVPNNYRTSDNETPLYTLMKNAVTPRTTETFEITGDNPANISDLGLKYILMHGYNTTNTTNTVFSQNKYGAVTDNNIKEYITQMAFWLYLLENKTKFTSNYCQNINVHLKESDTTINAWSEMSACDFYSYTTSPIKYSDYFTYEVTPTTAQVVRSIITAAAQKTAYNYLNYITQLVDEAETYTGNDLTSSMQGFSNNSINYKIAADGTSLTTDEITPVASGNAQNYLNYSVKLKDPNDYGAYLTDTTGNKLGSTSNLTSGFKIYVPLTKEDIDLSSIEVEITGSFLKISGYGYRVTKSTANDLDVFDDVKKKQIFADVILGDIPIETASVTLTLKNLTKVSKVDVTNQEELPGANLVIKDKKTQEQKQQWTSTSTPKYFYLENGEYTLCETTAPRGYQLNQECVDFTVDGSKITSVTMENAPEVPIPNTGLFANILPYIIGGLIIMIGAGIIGTTIMKVRRNQQ